MTSRNKQVITIYSPQGGSGKTTLAIATAMISAQSGKKTLLVDGAIYGSLQAAFHLAGTEGRGLEAAISQNEIGRNSDEIRGYLEKTLKKKNRKKICLS